MSNLIVRKLVSGDPVFGHGLQGFLTKSSATAQKCACRVRMILGEWFLDVNAGLPWVAMPEANARVILGEPNVLGYAEGLIKQAIINTPGVSSIEEFRFTLNHDRRAGSVYVTAKDEDGTTFEVEASFP
jgi:hypothetical protein